MIGDVSSARLDGQNGITSWMGYDWYRMFDVGLFFFFFQAEDGIRDLTVTGVQTCALPISLRSTRDRRSRGATPPRAGARRERRGDRSTEGSGAGRARRGRASAGGARARSEERRVGEEGRSRGAPYHLKKKKKEIEE